MVKSIDPFSAKENTKGYDLLTMDLDVKWPLNIVLSKRLVMKYQIINRFLFSCKYTERVLKQFWKNCMSLKNLDSNRLLTPMFLLLQRMLHFIKNLIYNICYEVIEKRWSILVKQLEEVKNFEDLIAYHENFISNCMKDMLLHENKFVKLVMTTNSLMIIFVKLMEKYPSSIKLEVNQINAKDEIFSSSTLTETEKRSLRKE